MRKEKVRWKRERAEEGEQEGDGQFYERGGWSKWEAAGHMRAKEHMREITRYKTRLLTVTKAKNHPAPPDILSNFMCLTR